MAEWNLTLDQSCFDDWQEPKVVIGGKDVTETLKQVSQLALTHQGDCSQQLEQELAICFPEVIEDGDVLSIIQVSREVSGKLKLFSRAIQILFVSTCKNIFPQVLTPEHSTHLKEYFECVEGCLNHGREIGDSSALIGVLKIIEKAYHTCGSTDNSDELFRLSSRLLNIALSIIEQPNFNHGDMTDLLEPLIAIGKHSCKIDAKSMAFIWKFLLKTLQQNPELCRSLDLSASVTFLVQEIHRLLDLLRQNPTNVSKLAKIAGFLIKVVVGLVEKDATILRGESENEAVLSLVLQLLRYSPDMVKHDLALSNDLVQLLELHISVAVHPLLGSLSKSRHFLSTLRRSSPSDEQRLSFIRLLGLLLTPTYQVLVVKDSDNLASLMDLFLSGIDQAHSEFNQSVQLNGVAHSGQAVQLVPVYELLVTQACSGMAVAQPDNVVESVGLLFKFVVNGGFWSCLMSCDILCFLARYGSSQFCLEMVQHTFGLLSVALDNRLVCLINRLIPLLSPAGRSSLLKLHPPEKHQDVWAAINWRSFAVEQQTALQRCILPPPGSQQPIKAALLLRLRSLNDSDNYAAFKERTDLLPGLIKVASQLATGLNNSATKDYRRHVEYLLPGLLRVLLCFAQPGQKDQHFQLMQILKCATDAKILALAMLDVTDFLSGIGSMGVTSSPQQPAILRVIAGLFCETTASRSFLIQQSALRAFELFFKTTPHDHLAASSIRDGQDGLVKDFINRRATKPSVADMAAFWRDQRETLLKPPRQTEPLPKLPFDPETTAESNMGCPTAKRPRLETDEQLQFLLSNLGRVVTDVGLHCPLPDWSKEEIREHINLLKSYL